MASARRPTTKSRKAASAPGTSARRHPSQPNNRSNRVEGRAPERPSTRGERRRAARVRRNRLIVILAAGVSVLVVVSWFPESELLHQHQQVAAAVTRLDRLHRQDQGLAQEAKRLESPSEIARIAEQQYGLEKPGQQDYQVLPASGSSRGALATRGSTDTHSGTAGSKDHSVVTASGSADGFFNRMVNTLEFWR